jgi:hypothetical protein
VHTRQAERQHILGHRLIDLAAQPDEVGAVVEPVGELITYGVGVALMEMRDTVKARGRAPVKA